MGVRTTNGRAWTRAKRKHHNNNINKGTRLAWHGGCVAAASVARGHTRKHMSERGASYAREGTMVPYHRCTGGGKGVTVTWAQGAA